MRDECAFRSVPRTGIQVLRGAQVLAGAMPLPSRSRRTPHGVRAGLGEADDDMGSRGRRGSAETGIVFERKEGPAAHATGCSDRRPQNATVAVVTYWRGSV